MVSAPCFQLPLAFPFFPPGLAPPCFLQTLLPRIAGAWQGLPVAFAVAEHRGAAFNCFGSRSLWSCSVFIGPPLPVIVIMDVVLARNVDLLAR